MNFNYLDNELSYDNNDSLRKVWLLYSFLSNEENSHILDAAFKEEFKEFFFFVSPLNPCHFFDDLTILDFRLKLKEDIIKLNLTLSGIEDFLNNPNTAYYSEQEYITGQFIIEEEKDYVPFVYLMIIKKLLEVCL